MAFAAVLLACPVKANPLGGTVVQGAASISSLGSQLTIQQTSPRAQINWSSFNIGVGETTTFIQPSASSLVWNQIHDANPSQILGNLNANGYVVLQNSSGFYIGGQAAISTHGLLMTTAPIPVPDLSSGGAWDFNALPPTASIINYGQLRQPDGDFGGSVFLIAADIENHGTISAPQGKIGLYAGEQVLVSSRPDGRGLSAKVTLPQGSIDNQGAVIADAGTIEMNAQVVNQGGLVQANSAVNVNGVIELVAGDQLSLGPNSVLSAHGDTTSSAASQGGFVVMKSANTFADTATAAIDVSGKSGGRDGVVEILGSGVTAATVQSQIDGQSAPAFSAVGDWLLINPQNLTFSSSASTPAASNPNLNLTDLSSFSKIDLYAAGNIKLNSTWSLADSLDPNARLSLSAGNSITLANFSGIAAGKNWNLDLSAGPQNPALPPDPGTDGIYLNGSSYLQTQDGDINVSAANEILVNSGTSGSVGNNGIRTLAGGNINVAAQYGDVNAGANALGFNPRFTAVAPFYTVSKTLGGISTAAGGNVTISAGGNVISYLPYDTGTTPTGSFDGGSGAFGSNPGDVTITAGGSVFGHFVVANGTGTINAGQDIGGPVGSDNVALSLIKGAWNLNAPSGNIYLQEVRNPNGVFNALGNPGFAGNHLFDYDPHAAVTLNAGVGVYLTGLNLPRGDDAVPVIFPPTLEISAGSGGVLLGDNVTLFPSAFGELRITTTAGGGLAGIPNNPGLTPTPELLMSDSGETHWTGTGSFSDTEHAKIPPELNNRNQVIINVAGDMNNLILDVSKASAITVGGDMSGCSFSGQNLHAGDVTSIDVAGQIFNRGAYSFVFLPGAIGTLPSADTPPSTQVTWSSLLSAALDPAKLTALPPPPNQDRSTWAAYVSTYARLLPVGNPGFVYNDTTHRLGFNGQMSEAVRAGLEQQLTVLRYGPDGFPILDSTGHFVTDKITWAAASQIEELYQASLGAPDASSPSQLGYRLGGPGQFNVHAGSISLGNSYGILATGTGDPVGNRYGNLAPYTPIGASVNVSIDGDLDMITSTIAALAGGDVNVISTGGSLDLGSQELFNVPRSVALGVYTSGRGNVSVTAKGDINVNGSRIAAYNGGNISVTSLEGNVDAGSGGTTFVNVYSYYVDPVSKQPGSYQELVFGSGIVANTLVEPGFVPGSATRPGNITIETPQGDIRASLGGIVQEALNGNISAGPTITLVAGDRANGYHGNIDLGESGVIGGTVNVDANGNITGLVISRQNATITAAQAFSGTVLSGGTANLSAGGTISGTVVGIGGVSASGGQGVSATLLSQNVSVGGAQAQSTLGTSATGTAAGQSAAQQANTDAQQQVGTSATAEEDDQKKKNTKLPVLVRRVGRVTVILPPGS